MVDDDPVHLKIYGWIIESAGYRALPVEVQVGCVDLPDEPPDLVLLDYHFAGGGSAINIAKLIQEQMPQVPVLVLSDAPMLPDDIAPLVQGFIRKGDPAKLVDRLHASLGPAP
jgi:DNA-binding response OmpR family regulator